MAAFVVVGEEKHTGTQDPTRGASRARLRAAVREWLYDWGCKSEDFDVHSYIKTTTLIIDPWTERDGIICVDPLTHL